MNKLLSTILESCDHVAQKCETNEGLVKIGIISGISAVIMACVATHKSEKIINETKAEITDILNDPEIPEEEKQKTIVKKSAGSAVKIAGLYTAVGALQYTSFKAYGKTINNLQNENMILTSIAMSALQRLVDYRRIWQEKVGKEAEEEAYYGVEKKTISVMENGKMKKKKARVINQPPANKNILLFAPWTSPLYIDEEEYVCPGINRKRIYSAISTAGSMLNYSSDPYLSNNDIAYLLSITKSADWYTEGFVRGDNISYSIREVYALWEGKYIPVYYIELNSHPFLQERVKEVLPAAPDYEKELELI